MIFRVNTPPGPLEVRFAPPCAAGCLDASRPRRPARHSAGRAAASMPYTRLRRTPLAFRSPPGRPVRRRRRAWPQRVPRAAVWMLRATLPGGLLP